MVIYNYFVQSSENLSSGMLDRNNLEKTVNATKDGIKSGTKSLNQLEGNVTDAETDSKNIKDSVDNEKLVSLF